MEVIYNDHVDRNFTAFVLSCYFQKFFLGLITQLALPESHTVLRHHRNLSCGIGICLFNLSRRISCRNPVIQFLRRLYFPCGDVLVKADAPYRRVIPQKTISQRRKCERHAGLGITVCQFKLCSLYIQELLLILPHTIYLLIRIGLESHSQ